MMKVSKVNLGIFLISFLLPSLGQAATITVNITTDEFATGGSNCSLREALEATNSGAFGANTGNCSANSTGALGTNDIINLAANTTYILSLCSGPGGFCGGSDADDLDICSDVQIVGGNGTVIDASGLVPCGGRIIEVINSSGVPTVSLSNMTVQNGDTVTPGEPGGGLLNHGILNLNNVTVTENQGDDVGGGGIYNDGTMSIQNSIIQGNSTQSFGGAGVFTTVPRSGVSSLTINNSTIDGNFFTNPNVGFHGGGGIFVEGDTTITNSTISNNAIDTPPNSVIGNQGGGIFYSDDSRNGTLNIINSTISGNTVDERGGGILVNAPLDNPTPNQIVNLFNVTIANNSSLNVTNPASGGGIEVRESNPNTITLGTILRIPVNLSNSLIATNDADAGPDCFGMVISDQGYNLLGINDGNCNGLTDGVNFDQVGTGTPIDPLIGPLQNNGGPTDTHALLFNTVPSPAIDQGDPAGCVDQNASVLNQDQRGFTRPVDATDIGTAICDIGAYEFQVEAPIPSPSPLPPPTGCLQGSGLIGGNNGAGCGGCSLSLRGDAPLPTGILFASSGLVLGIFGWFLRVRERRN